nr:DNA/RNA non-specific endonuclease [Clostridium beijerinckii]
MLKDFSVGSGFNTKFLGEEFEIPFPKVIGKTKEDALNDGEIFNFNNFSIVMNEKTKFAIYSVCNIDENKYVKISRTDDWHFDQRIKEENQVGNEFYRNNYLDRGHLTRRKDVCWGTESQARKANYDSFCFANICFQDHDFNTGTWNDFEDWILDELEGKDMKMKMSIFTGPINRDSDRIYCGAGRGQDCGVRIPAGFWKVVIYVDSNKELRCLAFMGKQDEFWYDETGKKLEKHKVYQVPLNLISELTEIEFDSSLYNANPLYYWPNKITARNNIATPQIHLISERDDIIF